MKLRDKVRPSDPPLEDDIYEAVCVMIADVGQQVNPNSQRIENKVVFSFEIPSERVEREGKQVPRQLSRWFTYSTSDRGALKPALTAWLGKNSMSSDEMLDLDLFDFVGMGARLVVGTTEGGRNKIESIKPLKRGAAVPAHTSPILTFDIDEDGFESERFKALPDWVREAIEKSEQYQCDPPRKALDMPAEQEDAIDKPQGSKGDCPI